MSGSPVRQAIVQESVDQYLATGHPCACPDNVARNGTHCNATSSSSAQRVGGELLADTARSYNVSHITIWRLAA